MNEFDEVLWPSSAPKLPTPPSGTSAAGGADDLDRLPPPPPPSGVLDPADHDVPPPPPTGTIDRRGFGVPPPPAPAGWFDLPGHGVPPPPRATGAIDRRGSDVAPPPSTGSIDLRGLTLPPAPPSRPAPAVVGLDGLPPTGALDVVDPFDPFGDVPLPSAPSVAPVASAQTAAPAPTVAPPVTSALPVLPDPGPQRPSGAGRPPSTPVLGLPLVGPLGRPRRRRGAPLGAIAASGAGVLLAVALVTAFVLRTATSDDCVAALSRPAVAPVAFVAPLPARVPPIDTSWSPGQVTYYGPASPDGACMGTSTPANRFTVALGPQEYADGFACGTYVDIRGPRGTIRAKVTNLCPECATGHLDLSDEAFAALDDPRKGIAQISYRAVRNPSVGPLTVRVKEGSNPYWLALRIDNHGNPLESVEVRTGGGWQALQLQNYGYWVLGSGAGNGPFQVRITDAFGNRAVVKGVRLAPGQVQSTGVQLYGAGAAAPPAPTTRKATPTARTSAPARTAGPTATATAPATATATAPVTTSTTVPAPTGTASPDAAGTTTATEPVTASAPLADAAGDRC